MSTNTVPRMTYKEWKKRGRELFGPDGWQWRFTCPECQGRGAIIGPILDGVRAQLCPICHGEKYVPAEGEEQK